MRHFDIVDIITEGIHSDERSNLEIDEYNYMFHNILNVHNTISKNYNVINNGLHNLHRKLETVWHDIHIKLGCNQISRED